MGAAEAWRRDNGDIGWEAIQYRIGMCDTGGAAQVARHDHTDAGNRHLLQNPAKKWVPQNHIRKQDPAILIDR